MKLTLAALLFAAACGTPDAPARFASASDLQLARALDGAAGTDAYHALELGASASGETSTGCPAISTSGSRTTVTARQCDDDDVIWDGSLVIDNAPGSPGYDETVSITMTFAHLTAQSGFTPAAFAADGTVTSDRLPSDALPGELTIDSDLTFSKNGVAVTSTLHLVPDGDGMWTASDSAIDVDGLGTATVEGHWGSAGRGGVVLRGADEIVFDLADIDADGCVGYAVGARTGHVCDQD